MDCPKCVGKLEEIKISGEKPFVIDRCFACGGLWFDREELSKIIDKEIMDTVELEVEKGVVDDKDLLREINLDQVEIVCPRCPGNKKMEKIASPRNKNVFMDYCKDCNGVWLDAGEYSKLSKRDFLETKLEHIVDLLRLHFPLFFKKKS